jgi:hypothetical protein
MSNVNLPVFQDGITQLNAAHLNEIKRALLASVEQIAGKGLSTQDFTTELKAKLDGLGASPDLSAYVLKVVNKQLSTNDYTDIDKAKVAGFDPSTFQPKEAGKGLSANDFTNTLKAKLDSLTSGGTGGITLPEVKAEINNAGQLYENKDWAPLNGDNPKAPVKGGRSKYKRLPGQRTLINLRSVTDLGVSTGFTNVAAPDAPFGANALQLTFSAATTYNIYNTATFPALDVRNGSLRMWHKAIQNLIATNGVTPRLDRFAIELHSAGTPAAITANYHSLSIGAAPSEFSGKLTSTGQGAGRWQTYGVPVNNLSVIGAGADLSKVIFARIVFRGTTDASNPIILQLGNLEFIPNPLTKAKVILSFDDSFLSHLSIAAYEMSKYGFKGVAFPSPANQVGVAAGKMTAQQIRTLHDVHGWQIGSQAWSSEDATFFDGLGEDGMTSELAKIRNWQASLGVTGGEHGSYFSNVTVKDLTAYPAFRKHFRSMRRFDAGASVIPPMSIGESFPFGDPMNIKAMNGATPFTSAYGPFLIAHVQQAIDNRGVAYFGWHDDLATTTAAKTGFDALLAFLDANRDLVDVVTEEELYELNNTDWNPALKASLVGGKVPLAQLPAIPADAITETAGLKVLTANERLEIAKVSGLTSLVQPETTAHVLRIRAAGGDIDARTINEIDRFIVRGKKFGWYAKMFQINFRVGTTLAAALLSLKGPDHVNNGFVPADYSPETGLVAVGNQDAKKYISHNFIPADQSLNGRNLSIGIVVLNNSNAQVPAAILSQSPSVDGPSISLADGYFGYGPNAFTRAAGVEAMVAAWGEDGIRFFSGGVPIYYNNQPIPTNIMNNQFNTEFCSYRGVYNNLTYGFNTSIGTTVFGSSLTHLEGIDLNQAMQEFETSIGRMSNIGGKSGFIGDSNMVGKGLDSADKRVAFRIAALQGQRQVNFGSDGSQLREYTSSLAAYGGFERYPQIIKDIKLNTMYIGYGGTNDRNIGDATADGNAGILTDFKNKLIVMIEEFRKANIPVVLISAPADASGANVTKQKAYLRTFFEAAYERDALAVDIYHLGMDTTTNGLYSELVGNLLQGDQIHITSDYAALIAKAVVDAQNGRIYRNVKVDFPSIPANGKVAAPATIEMNGAKIGMTVTIGTGAASNDDVLYTGKVTALNTVSLIARNFTGAAIDPAIQTLEVTVFL